MLLFDVLPSWSSYETVISKQLNDEKDANIYKVKV